jgi:uncharacterized protein YneF (UPF0154 family)
MLVTYGENLHSGWFYSLHSRSFDAHLLVAQFVGILFIFGWVFFLMFPFFIWLNYMGWFRADALEELVGLDISYHGGGGTHNDEVKQEYVDAFQRKRGRAVATTETEMPYGEEEEEYQGQPEGYDQGQMTMEEDMETKECKTVILFRTCIKVTRILTKLCKEGMFILSQATMASQFTSNPPIIKVMIKAMIKVTNKITSAKGLVLTVSQSPRGQPLIPTFRRRSNVDNCGTREVMT